MKAQDTMWVENPSDAAAEEQKEISSLPNDNTTTNETLQAKKEPWYLAIASFFDRLHYSMFRNYTSIFKNTYQSRIKNLELAIKVLLVVVAFFMLLTLFLTKAAISASSEKNLNVVVPEFISSGTYTVMKDSASVPYYELIAKGFVMTAANYNYMDAEKKINSLLPSILPFTYSSTFDDIKKNVQFIVDEKVSQEFLIQKVETLVKGSRAKIEFSGLLTRTVGSIKVIENRPYKIPVILKIVDYTPYIESFDFDYVGISKAEKDDNIALKREEEIAQEEALRANKEARKQSAYQERLEKRKDKDKF